MNRLEHLLTQLGEECAEVAQRASKAARFGIMEVQPGQDMNNARRITNEVEDMIGVVELLQAEGVLPQPDRSRINAKKEKIEKYLRYARECGTLS